MPRWPSITLLALSLLACGQSADVSDPPLTVSAEAWIADSRDHASWSHDLAEVDGRLEANDLEESDRYRLLVYRAFILMRLADLEWQAALDEYDRCLDGWTAPGVATEPCVNPTPDQRVATAAFEQVLATDPAGPNTDEALYYLGELAMEGRDGSSAVVSWTQLLDEHPDSSYRPAACLGLGDYYFDQALAVPAEEAYQCALEGGDDDVRSYATYKLAWLDYNFQRYESAYERLHQVAEASRERDDELRQQAIRDLVLIYTDLPDGPSRGLVELPALCTDAAEATYLLERLSVLYAERGMVAECRAVLDGLTETYPDSGRHNRWEAQSADPSCRQPP